MQCSKKMVTDVNIILKLHIFLLYLVSSGLHQGQGLIFVIFDLERSIQIFRAFKIDFIPIHSRKSNKINNCARKQTREENQADTYGISFSFLFLLRERSSAFYLFFSCMRTLLKSSDFCGLNHISLHNGQFTYQIWYHDIFFRNIVRFPDFLQIFRFHCFEPYFFT